MAIIVHVDDSSFTRMQIGRTLKKAGHETIEADSGKRALEILQTMTPDLIISDILMPEMDGIAFLEALLDRCNAIPVIMVTADVQEETVTACLELGAVELLNKPPNEEKLLAVIGRILAKGE